MGTSELACTYAALILHDDGLDITVDNINAICKAANVTVEAFWPPLFAKLFETKSVADLITNVGAGGGGGGAPAAGGGDGGGAAAAAPEPEPEEEEEEEDVDFDLFD